MSTPSDATALLERLHALPGAEYAAGERLIEAGTRSGKLMVLQEGQLEVSRDGLTIGTIDAPGTVVGEIAALLGGTHTADVRALRQTRVVIADAEQALHDEPAIALHVARTLAQRLDEVNRQLLDLRRELGAQPDARALDQGLDRIARAVLFGGTV